MKTTYIKLNSVFILIGFLLFSSFIYASSVYRCPYRFSQITTNLNGQDQLVWVGANAIWNNQLMGCTFVNSNPTTNCIMAVPYTTEPPPLSKVEAGPNAGSSSSSMTCIYGNFDEASISPISNIANCAFKNNPSVKIDKFTTCQGSANQCAIICP